MWKASESIFIVYFGVCGLLFAQSESRSDLVEEARTQKEANLTPETPPKGEIRIESIEHSLPYRLLTGEVDGFGVGISNIVPGSSVAAGPQYRRSDLFGGRLTAVVQARVSANQSYLGRLDLLMPDLLGGKAFLGFTATHRDISEMPYYGPGPDSRKTGRSDYRLEDTNVELRPGVRIYKGLSAALIGSYLLVNVGAGHSTQFISTEQQLLWRMYQCSA